MGRGEGIQRGVDVVVCDVYDPVCGKRGEEQRPPHTCSPYIDRTLFPIPEGKAGGVVGLKIKK